MKVSIATGKDVKMTIRAHFVLLLAVSNIGCSSLKSIELPFAQTVPQPPKDESPRRHFVKDIPIHAGNVFVGACHVSALTIYTLGVVFFGGATKPYDPPPFVNPWAHYADP